MCVIAVCEHGRPSGQEIQHMWDQNPHGSGIAWQETTGGAPTLFWKKGLDLAGIQDYAKTVPLPYALHFRIKTIGRICPQLCHPFEVSEHTSTDTSGSTQNGQVLFHNGNWPAWDIWVKDALKAAAGRLKIPSGVWSDSRAMAWLASAYGPGILELINERVILMSPTDIEIFGGHADAGFSSGWSYYESENEADNKPLILVSNQHWVKKTSKTETTGGSRAAAPFCETQAADHVRTEKSSTGKPTGRESKKQTEKPVVQLPPDWPKDIPNAFRRGQISFDLVQAAHAIKAISDKAFKKLTKTHDRREWSRKQKESKEQEAASKNQITLH